MAHGFKRVDREQQFLLPPDVREWLPEGHLAWLVIDAVDQLDLEPFEAGYRLGGAGRQAYDPAMLLALLLYGYAIGEGSSRRLERACETDVAFRVLAANQRPDHATIARFRARHGDAIEDVFGQVVGLCVSAGLVDARLVAVDSTKMGADASPDANLTEQQLRDYARRVLDEAAAVDAEEDARYGDKRGDEPNPGWEPGPGREAKIREALEQLRQQSDGRAEIEQRQQQRLASGRKPLGRKPLPPDPDKPWRVASKTDKKQRRANVTDPDSRMMRTPKGWRQAFTAQAVTDPSQIILAAQVTNDQNDNRALKPMLEAARDHLDRAGHDRTIRAALADRGYWNTNDIDDIETGLGIATLIATVRDRHLRAGKSRADTPSHQKMHLRFQHPSAKRLYRRRSTMIEPIFGQLKTNRRLDRFLQRGLAAVNTEWNLICTAHNLAKLHTATTAPAT